MGIIPIPAAAAPAAEDEREGSLAFPGLKGVTILGGPDARADVGVSTFMGDAAPAGTGLSAAGRY